MIAKTVLHDFNKARSKRTTSLPVFIEKLKLNVDIENVDDEFTAYHFDDDSVLMTKGRGPNWQAWTAISPRPKNAET